MKAWQIVFGWNDGKNPPTEDGTYYVATYYEGMRQITLNTLDYTVEYGWNTTKRAHESAFEIEETHWWTPAIRIEPNEIIDLERPDQEGRP